MRWQSLSVGRPPLGVSCGCLALLVACGPSQVTPPGGDRAADLGDHALSGDAPAGDQLGGDQSGGGDDALAGDTLAAGDTLIGGDDALGGDETPLASTKVITAFTFYDAANSDLGTDVDALIDGTSISASVPFGTDRGALVPTVVFDGASLSPASDQAQDFSASLVTPVRYTVFADDGSSLSYLVRVAVAPSPAKELTAFWFAAAHNTQLASDVSGVIDGGSISLAVPPATDPTALVASFTTSGVSVTVDGTSQASGVTANDFTSPRAYLVHAADASTRSYTVQVAITPGIARYTRGFTYDGGTMQVVGTGFGPAAGGNAISVGGMSATILSWADGLVTFKVPAGAPTYDVVVTPNGQAALNAPAPMNELNLTTLSPVSTMDTAALIVSADGQYLHSFGWNTGIYQVFDLTDPAVPVYAGTSLSLGSGYGFDLRGDYAFVAAGGNGADFVSTDGGFVVVDVGTPSAPAIAASDTTDAEWNHMDVTITGDVACVIAYTQVIVFDITDPLAPVHGTTIADGTAAWQMGRARDGYCYVSHHGDPGRVDVIDARVPATASIVGSVNAGQFLLGLDLWGDYLYTVEETSGTSRRIFAINISNPSNPMNAYNYTLLNTFTSRGNDLFIVDGYAFVVGSRDLAIVDVWDPSAMRRVGIVPNLSGDQNQWGGAVFGRYAYVADNALIKVVRLY